MRHGEEFVCFLEECITTLREKDREGILYNEIFKLLG